MLEALRGSESSEYSTVGVTPGGWVLQLVHESTGSGEVSALNAEERSHICGETSHKPSDQTSLCEDAATATSHFAPSSLRIVPLSRRFVELSALIPRGKPRLLLQFHTFLIETVQPTDRWRIHLNGSHLVRNVFRNIPCPHRQESRETEGGHLRWLSGSSHIVS